MIVPAITGTQWPPLLVAVTLISEGGAVTGARLTSPQPLTVGPAVAAELVGSACSLSFDDIETGNHLPCIASCGAAFIVAELTNREALPAASPRADVFRDQESRHTATRILLYSQADGDEVDIRARMFAPHRGIY